MPAATPALPVNWLDSRRDQAMANTSDQATVKPIWRHAGPCGA